MVCCYRLAPSECMLYAVHSSGAQSIGGSRSSCVLPATTGGLQMHSSESARNVLYAAITCTPKRHRRQHCIVLVASTCVPSVLSVHACCAARACLLALMLESVRDQRRRPPVRLKHLRQSRVAMQSHIQAHYTAERRAVGVGLRAEGMQHCCVHLLYPTRAPSSKPAGVHIITVLRMCAAASTSEDLC